MVTFLLLLLIGVSAGIIDILPMIKMKLDRHSIASAFMFHLIAPTILYHIQINVSVWLKGGIVYLLLAIPLIIFVNKKDKKGSIIMIISSIIIGTVVALIESTI